MRPALQRLVTFYRLQLRLLMSWEDGRRALLRRLLVATVVSYLAFGATIALVPGITVTTPQGVLAAVTAIGLLNALLRPVALSLAIPLGILGVGVLGVAMQVVVLLAVARIVPGLDVRDPLAALQGAVAFSVFNTALSWFVALGDDESYYGHLVRLLIREHAGAARSDRPGVVIVQIDGLSHPVLLNEIRAGRVPTMSRWLRSASHGLARWECGLPSQTSASQAGILFGSNDGIPAFRWYEKPTGRLMVSNRPPDAAEIERRLSTGSGLLAGGGSSIGNLFSGDAGENLLTMSRLADPIRALGPTRSWFYFMVSPFSFARAMLLTIGETGKEVWQARRQRVAWIEPRIERGGAYPLLRAVTNVALRQLTTALCVERILRGVPILYVDFVDYDEIAHHAGPERAESLDALEGVDRVLRALERAAREAPRPYHFIVLSDHGQSQGATFRQRYGVTLEALIHGLIDSDSPMTAATSPVEGWGAVNALLSQITGGAGAGARMAGRILRGRTRDGYVELGPGARQPRGHAADGSQGLGGGRPDVAGLSGRLGGDGPAQEQRDRHPELVVCASGNLALVYLNRRPQRLTLEEITAAYPGLIEALAGHPGIGFVVARSEAHGNLALGAGGCNYLDEGRIEGSDPLAPFGPHAVRHVRRVASMPETGDLVINSRLDPDTNEVAAFEELVGSHGGIGGWQTDAFILHPAAWPVATDGPIVGAPAVHQQLVQWLETAGLRERIGVQG